MSFTHEHGDVYSIGLDELVADVMDTSIEEAQQTIAEMDANGELALGKVYGFETDTVEGEAK